MGMAIRAVTKSWKQKLVGDVMHQGLICVHLSEIAGNPYNGEVQPGHVLDVLVTEYGLDALRQKVSSKLAGGSMLTFRRDKCN